MINRVEEYIKMSNVEHEHWWYKSLRELVLDTINKEFHQKRDISILDAGCGTGGLMNFLINNQLTTIEGFDLSSTAIDIAKEKGLNVSIGDLAQYKHNNKKYDVIISNDTMYFFSLDEQKKILDEFYKSLNYNGIVILNLPYSNIFSGMHDKAVGIQQRFTRKMVNDMIDFKKYNIVRKTYWPFVLSPIILVTRSFQKLKLFLNKDIKIESDIAMPSNLVNSILYRLVAIENRYLPKKPIGSSLFLVLKRTIKY